jgi:hypothetical protein
MKPLKLMIIEFVGFLDENVRNGALLVAGSAAILNCRMRWNLTDRVRLAAPSHSSVSINVLDGHIPSQMNLIVMKFGVKVDVLEGNIR